MLFSQERFRESYEQLERVAGDTSYEGPSLVFEGLDRSALRLGRQEDAKAAFQRALQLRVVFQPPGRRWHGFAFFLPKNCLIFNVILSHYVRTCLIIQ